MKRIILGVLLILSIMFVNAYATDEPNTGHQSESAWVPITLILTCVTIAIISCMGGDIEKKNVIKIEEEKYDTNNL